MSCGWAESIFGLNSKVVSLVIDGVLCWNVFGPNLGAPMMMGPMMMLGVGSVWVQ